MKNKTIVSLFPDWNVIMHKIQAMFPIYNIATYFLNFITFENNQHCIDGHDRCFGLSG